MTSTNHDNPFKWRHYQEDSILLCVRWYLRYRLSYRDLAERMYERGLTLDHTTIYRWVQAYTPELEKRTKRQLISTNDSWRVDETYVNVRGQWMYLYRALDSEDSERVFADMCRCNREIARYGAEKGVIVALQNHNHGNLVATAPDVIRTLDETDHPNFAFLLDTGQWRGSAGANPEHIFDPTVDIYGYIEQTLPRAVYVRTKFYRVESGEETVLDYGRIAAILRDGGYNGPLSIVYEGEEEDRVNAVAKAAAHLRRVFGNVLAVG